MGGVRAAAAPWGRPGPRGDHETTTGADSLLQGRGSRGRVPRRRRRRTDTCAPSRRLAAAVEREGFDSLNGREGIEREAARRRRRRFRRAGGGGRAALSESLTLCPGRRARCRCAVPHHLSGTAPPAVRARGHRAPSELPSEPPSESPSESRRRRRTASSSRFRCPTDRMPISACRRRRRRRRRDLSRRRWQGRGGVRVAAMGGCGGAPTAELSI